MKPYILPYKMGSVSAKALALGLDTKLIKKDNSSFVHRDDRLVINWGNSQPHPKVNPERMLNSYAAVALAANKLHFFREFQGHPVVKTPEFTTNAEEAEEYLSLGKTLFARTVLTGHSGQGIVVITPEDELIDAPLYTLQFPTKREYRVHVVNGSVIDVTQKKKRRDTEVNMDIRNYDGGWVFARNDIEQPPEEALTMAIAGVTDLGLDFGACDVLVSEDNRVVICEINTAPGIEGTTLEKYINAFKGYI